MRAIFRTAVGLALVGLGIPGCSDVSEPHAGAPMLGRARGTIKVTVCHNGETITVAAPALVAHLAHGDTEGPCLACVAPPADLISWWPGDGDATDMAGLSDGTLHGGATFETGVVDQAFSFDGSDDHVVVADHPNLRGLDDFSFGGWFKSTSLALPNTIMSKYNDHQNRNLYSLYHFTTGRVWCSLSDGTSSYNFVSAMSNSSVNTNEWHHVMCVRRGTTLDLYIDGLLDGTSPIFGTTLHPFADLQIGRDRWWDGAWWDANYFDGLLDELAVFDRALSAEEIADLYGAGGAGMCKS